MLDSLLSRGATFTRCADGTLLVTVHNFALTLTLTHTNTPPLSNPQLVSTNTYEVLTADNCCCGTCRMLGWDNYDALRDLVNGIDSALRKCSNNRCVVCVRARARARHVHMFVNTDAYKYMLIFVPGSGSTKRQPCWHASTRRSDLGGAHMSPT